ncbi:MAG: hypothetical protein JXB62_11150 [Pirellulales bacterium]|nr:hypothetical protein [Pirellulales bacterium]
MQRARTLVSVLAVVGLLVAPSVCPAQATALKPVVTVSFSGYDALFEDIGFVGQLGDNPALAQGLEGMLGMFTGGKGVAGLDKAKPWGLVVQTDGMQFPAVVFVPVSDMKQLLEVVAPFAGEPADAGGGVLKLESPGGNGKPVFVKEQGGWAFLADKAESLASVPADPLQLLGGLQQKYDVAVRASIQAVPAPLRDQIAAQVKAGAEMANMRQPGESDDQYAIRTGMTRQALDQFVDTVNDLDELLVGLAVDGSAGTVYLDVQITAVAGTKTAAQFAEMAETTTDFAGFDLPGAALTGNWAGVLSDTDVAQAKTAIAGIRTSALKELADQELSAAERQMAEQAINDLLDVADKTIDGKKADGGVVLILKPGATTLVAGGILAEGSKLEKTVKQLASLAVEEAPELGDALKLDAETHQGVRFHTFSMPTPEPDLAKVIGDQFNLVLGVTDTSVYLAVGADAAATLKQVIDKSASEAGKQIPPMRLSIAAGPIAQFVAAVAEGSDKEIPTMIAGILSQVGDKDHVTLTTTGIPNGASTRLELEEGLLKAIGQAIQKAAMGGGPGGPPGGSPF